MNRAALNAIADAADALARLARAAADDDAAAPEVVTDDLILIAHAPLEARGFELKPIVRAVESGALRTVRLGRRRYTRATWLAELADKLTAATPIAQVDDLAEAARRRAARKAG